MLNYRKGLADMPAYDVIERPWGIKVNANECNMNLPPLVEERVMARLGGVAFNRYPNEQYDDLREQIAKYYGVQKENVLLGIGSSEIIEKIFYCFGGGEERHIVYPQPSFSMYKIYAKAAEATGVPVDLRADYTFDADAFINKVQEVKADLAVICNPNNPTGTGIPLEDIKKVADNIDCCFLVDEAYMEFYGKSAFGMLKNYPNMIIARTFSKAYGLASCRVGYMVADAKIVDMIAKAYMPYYMNVLSLVTADTCFQMRQEFVPRIQMMIAERKRMSERYAELPGVKVYPSNTNFVLVKVPDAVALNESLVAKNIGIRSFGNAPRLENCLRLSMGLREENDRIFDEIKLFLEGRA